MIFLQVDAAFEQPGMFPIAIVVIQICVFSREFERARASSLDPQICRGHSYGRFRIGCGGGLILARQTWPPIYLHAGARLDRRKLDEPVEMFYRLNNLANTCNTMDPTICPSFNCINNSENARDAQLFLCRVQISSPQLQCLYTVTPGRQSILLKGTPATRSIHKLP